MNCPIVVGTDLTRSSDEALSQADARATRDNGALIVVHAISPLSWGASAGPEHVERLRELVRQQMASVTGRAPERYRVVVERGLVHSVLARWAIAQRGLLVVGSHMHHGIGHALLRDVTERVVRGARGPVLVTRPTAGSGRVLVSVEVPFNDSLALDEAIDEARVAQSRLAVMHAVGIGMLETLAADIVNGGAYAERPLGTYSRASDARRALQSELRRRKVTADIHVLEGEPEFLVPALASQISPELVVIGSPDQAHARVVTAVLRHAPCSVLVVDEIDDALCTSPSLQMPPS